MTVHTSSVESQALSAVTSRQSGPCRILVLDDDPLSRALQARMLVLLGHEAQVAQNADAAIHAALYEPVDGMLLDLSMPEMDGFAVLADIREQEAALNRVPLPVIAVTGYAAMLDRLRCLMAGFNDHLCKPVDAHTLASVLSRNVKSKQAELADNLDNAARLRADNDVQRVAATARRLAQVKPSDSTFGPTMLEAFAMRSGQLVEELQLAGRRRDSSGLCHAGLALSSSAEFMGASGLARLCSQLQSAAAIEDFMAVDTLLRQLQEEHQAVLTVLLRSAPSKKQTLSSL